jgi:hypothetical protein
MTAIEAESQDKARVPASPHTTQENMKYEWRRAFSSANTSLLAESSGMTGNTKNKQQLDSFRDCIVILIRYICTLTEDGCFDRAIREHL